MSAKTKKNKGKNKNIFHFPVNSKNASSSFFSFLTTEGLILLLGYWELKKVQISLKLRFKRHTGHRRQKKRKLNDDCSKFLHCAAQLFLSLKQGGFDTIMVVVLIKKYINLNVAFRGSFKS